MAGRHLTNRTQNRNTKSAATRQRVPRFCVTGTKENLLKRATKRWRRGRDSNPRNGSSPLTRFPVVPVKPLPHLSARDAHAASDHVRMAERQGFEPWEGKALNGFRDRPFQPLRHLSAKSSPGRKELAQECGAFVSEHPRYDIHAVVPPHIRGQRIDSGTARAEFGIPRTEHQPANP